MNNVEGTPLVRSRQVADGLGAELVEDAIQKLSIAVSLGDRRRRADVTAKSPRGMLADAVGEALAYFGVPTDALRLAAALRDGDADDAVRKVFEQGHIHVRTVQLNKGAGTLWGPVLAFRGEQALFLRPGIWSKWLASDGSTVRDDDLAPLAFTFYRALPSGPTTLRRLGQTVFGREDRRDLVYAIVWGVVSACLSGLSVYLMQALVDWALPEGERRSLALLTAGWCVVAITSSNLRLSRALFQVRIGTRVDAGTEAALVARALSLPLRVFKGMAAGDVSERISGASDFGRAAYGTTIDSVLALVAAAAYGTILTTTSWQAAAVVVLVIGVRAVVGGALLAGMYADGKTQATARGKMSGRLFEMLSGISRIKVASAESRAFYYWATAFANVRRAGYRASLFGGMLTASEGLFDVLGLVLVYWVLCASKAGGHGMQVGDFVVASACLGGLQSAYSDVVRGLTTLLPTLPKAQRAQPLLDAAAEARADAAPATLEGNVSLRHVTFHYADDDVRILDHVSLDIKKGEFVAIVGPSGCGKSTLIKMILGFYPPSSGSVLLDGKEIDSLDLRSVRSQIGAVLQGSELLPSSILFNIVGTSRKTLNDAWLAARRACIADDIEAMPMKMSTLLSDRAVTISGGQKQRILIARALVREPKLVIFDEATSALDNKTQAAVMSALQGLHCTKIFIAHRLSTVVHADRIVVMDKGAIVQQGTFESLMAQEGIFRTLAAAQIQGDK